MGPVSSERWNRVYINMVTDTFMTLAQRLPISGYSPKYLSTLVSSSVYKQYTVHKVSICFPHFYHFDSKCNQFGSFWPHKYLFASPALSPACKHVLQNCKFSSPELNRWLPQHCQHLSARGQVWILNSVLQHLV